MRSLLVGLVALLTVIGIHQQAGASLVINGDFETGDLTGWTWTADTGSEPNMVATVGVFDGSLAFRVNPGNDSGDGRTERGGTLSQMVTLHGGVTYAVSADLMAIQNLSGDNADGGKIAILLDGVTLHTFDVGGILTGKTIYDSFTGTYTATGTGSVPFDLRFTRSYRNFTPVMYHWADNISISAHVVPEPTSLAIWSAIALGGLGLAYRRRKRTA